VALPPLLSSRPPRQQIILANVVPAVFGLVTGLLLGVSEVAYLVLSLLGILGGYGAGLEHPTPGDGATRGVVGGVLFGSFILFGHELTGAEAKAHLPEPAILLVAITTVLGAFLGALGGRTRSKRIAAAPS
jgi:hypothetical protein